MESICQRIQNSEKLFADMGKVIKKVKANLVKLKLV